MARGDTGQIGYKVGQALKYAPSKQKMSTYASTPTDNFKRAGVGNTGGGKLGTSVGVKARSVTNTPTGGASKTLYPVHIINKAKAKMGGNSHAEG